MFGAIPASLIMDIARETGCYQQIDLDLQCPPKIRIDEDYLTDIPVVLDIEYTSNGKHHSLHSTIDHPSFTKTRDWLEKNGYIETQRNYSNGDIVLMPFYVNDVHFDVGDKFPCASAMKIHLKYKEKENGV